MESGPTLYYNAVVPTMAADGDEVDALLVSNGRIAAAGTKDALDRPGLTRVDLAGQTVVPGFNDCHCHILELGLSLGMLDVSADAVASIADIQRAVSDRASRAGSGEWILGRGYDQNLLRERRHPTRHDLDEASSGHPLVLFHTSGHVLTCNSAALHLAGIGVGTPPPPGGDIDRDEGGEPTGLLKESPAMDLVGRLLPEPDLATGSEAIASALRMMARHGITSASDAATGRGASIEPELAMYRRSVLALRMVRITLMPQIHYTAPPDSQEVVPPAAFDAGQEPDWLAIGPTKIFSDGALSTRTAAVREPYRDGTNRGILLWEQPVLESMIARAHRAGWQIATHALGDRAVEAVVAAYESALASAPRTDHRHRIEHCMLLDEALAARIRVAGVVPSLQPDIFRLGDGYVAALGPDRAAQSIPCGLFRRLGVPVAFSSDAPVIPCDPLDVIRSAIERRTPGGIALGREHSVTALEAIRNYTVGGAYATRTDTSKGLLSRDMLADFVVLSHDPSALPAENLTFVRVTMTVAGGTPTFTA